MIKILSIDGGGTRGILPAAVLTKLEQEMQQTDPDFRIRDAFDIITGTSTGGMISMCAGLGVPMQKLVDIYLNDVKRIFADSIWDNIKDMGNTLGAQYNQDGLENLLSSDDLLGGRTLGDIYNWRKNGKGVTVMVPTFDLSPKPNGPNRNFRPRVYNSFYERDHNEKLVELALSTTAAPTFFPVHKSKYIDGGVAMNNPSMAAVAFALNRKASIDGIYGGSVKKRKGLAVLPQDIILISLGTGTSGKERIEPEDVGDGDWGSAKWVMHMGALLTNSNMRAAEYYAESVLLERNYFRHQFDLQDVVESGEVDFDCTDDDLMKSMKAVGEKDFEKNKSRLMELLRR